MKERIDASVTDDRPVSVTGRRNVTPLTCLDCREPIGGADVVFRDNTWDRHVCDRCHSQKTKINWASHRKRICEWCGRPCYTLPGNTLTARFCSINCQRRYLRQVRRVVATCVCGGTFVPSRRNQQHCSVACKQRAYRDRGKAAASDNGESQ